MPEKKPTHSNPISAEEILAMYDTVLPLLYHEQEGLDATEQIRKHARTFIPFDYFHYDIEIALIDEDDRGLEIRLNKLERLDHAKPELLPKETFEEMLERDYQACVEEFHEKYGDQQKFDYYRILSNENPKIAIGLFRRTDNAGSNCFTKHDQQLLDRLAPHLFLMYRIIMLHTYHSENIQYFRIFTRLASKMVNDHLLSDSEVKLVPDILFGYSNEEIAERHFVSPATIKTHINHIFKKTDTKSRVEFITKFFTSPEHVQL